jgi:hypothetical protein
MKSVFHLIKRAFSHEPPLHPVDRGLAKRWIKQRLAAVFPELRKSPAALEKAYKSLSLEPRPGQHEGEAETVFEVHLPEGQDAEEK